MNIDPKPNPILRFLSALANWRLISIVKWLAIVSACAAILVFGGLLWVGRYPFAKVPGPDPVDRVVYLGQGWGPNLSSVKRQAYYYTAQGTSVKGLRYAWFVNLDKAWSNERFASPANLETLGFIVDKEKTPANPDQLPVGFARRYDPQVRENLLDITCAACHTGELHYTRQTGGKPERVAIRIDGGQAMHAFTSLDLGQFGPSLIAAMADTYLNPLKFDSFAHRVLGTGYSGAAKARLRDDFGQVLWANAKQGYIDSTHHLYPVEEGFGRTDAIGRISNQVFGTSLDEANYRVADAPVSYPPVWEIAKFDWVQYNASVSQPLARNLGESLGVGADSGLLDAYEAPIPKELRFMTSARIYDLVKIEGLLRDLRPPQWPEEILGPIDRQKAEYGKALYGQYCARCHEPCQLSAEDRAVDVPLRDADVAYWRIKTLPVEVIGTDPATAKNFVRTRVDLTKTGLTSDEVRPYLEKSLREKQRRLDEFRKAHGQPVTDGEAEIQTALRAVDVHSVSIGGGLNYLGFLMRARFFADHGIDDVKQEYMNGDGALDLPQVILAYKARPLGGMWATPPYLHNGSVPTVYELLLPADQRRKVFYTGRKDFDPKHLGIPMDQPATGFKFDATIPGNLNIGHEFRAGYREGGPPQFGVIGPELKDDQRWAIVEYLKIHNDDDASVPACRTSSYEPKSEDKLEAKTVSR
jgi:cytochrome c5